MIFQDSWLTANNGYECLIKNCISTTMPVVKVETAKGFEKAIFAPKRIVKNGVATIVFWQDGTKTIVKRSEGEQDSDYAAFTAALGIKLFGSNSALKRIVERTETQKPKKQKDDTLYSVGCPNCGSYFVKKPTEVRIKDGKLTTKCPSCGKLITADM